MKKQKRFRILRAWSAPLQGLAALAALAGLYLVQLGWPGKLTAGESAAAIANDSLSTLLHNPLNGLYKLVDFLWLQLPVHQTASARLASVTFALLGIVLFYVLAKRWHGALTALFAAILFAASSWMLHVGRLGDGQIMFVVWPIALLLLASWINTTKWHSAAILAFGITAGLACFTPGMLWLVIAMTVCLFGVLSAHLKKAKIVSIIGSFGAMVLCLLILGYAIWNDHSLLKPWLGIPNDLPNMIAIAKQLGGSISYLVLRGPGTTSSWLAHTPVLDVAATAMLLLGAYLYRQHLVNVRTRLLLAFFVIGCLLVALNGSVALGINIGIVYLVATTGLAFFTHKWFKVFPRNPFPRIIAIVLLSVLGLSVLTYHIERYFIAWQRSPATQEVFRQSANTSRPDLLQ